MNIKIASQSDPEFAYSCGSKNLDLASFVAVDVARGIVPLRNPTAADPLDT